MVLLVASMALSGACKKAQGPEGAERPTRPELQNSPSAPMPASTSSGSTGSTGSATGSGSGSAAQSEGSGSPAAPTPANEAPATLPAEAAALAAATNDFGMRLWRVASGAGNQAMSPVSIAAALAMTAGGARGATAEEMRKALRLTAGTDVAAQLAPWGALQAALAQPGHGNTLQIANRLFGEKAYPFEQAFIDFTSGTFAAPLEALGFRSDPEGQRSHINAWVADKTAGRIKDLLPQGAITQDTRLVLANAIYFLGKWATAFDAKRTRDADFWTSRANAVKVPTMHRTGMYATAELPSAKAVALPYQGGKLAMWLVVPNAKDGLATVEKELNAETLKKLAGSFTPNEIALAVPRFEVAPPMALSLVPGLKTLGMKAAFSAKADFTGIANPKSEPGLFVSDVFHKAFVKVDESGTEAAAATAVVMATRGVPAPTPAFLVDRPFLFLLVDTRANLVLFMGRVVNPAS